MRKFEKQLIFPFVTDLRTHQSTEKCRRRWGWKLEKSLIILKPHIWNSAPLMEIPSPPLPILPQKDIRGLIQGKSKMEGPSYRRYQCIQRYWCYVKSRGIRYMCTLKLFSKCWQPDSSHSGRRLEHLYLRNQTNLSWKTLTSRIP